MLPNTSEAASSPPRQTLLSYRQTTIFVGVLSIIFALVVFAHEIAVEGGFDTRNYVVIAFCFVWLVVDSMLLLGVSKRAHFMLLPWMILICVFTPLFVVGIVVGISIIDHCNRHSDVISCKRQAHMFGSSHATEATVKLGLLIFMFLVNVLSLVVVYKYIMILSGKPSSNTRQNQGFTYTPPEEAQSKSRHCKKYSRFRDENEGETNVPLCDATDDAIYPST